MHSNYLNLSLLALLAVVNANTQTNLTQIMSEIPKCAVSKPMLNLRTYHIMMQSDNP
jgi:hypothetical protein